jgi:hypothetical protein
MLNPRLLQKSPWRSQFQLKFQMERKDFCTKTTKAERKNEIEEKKAQT